MIIICFFVIGILVGLIDKEFEFSPATRFFLGAYIIVAVGLNGGIALAKTSNISHAIIVILISLAVVVIMPFYIYPICKKCFGALTGGAVAASYACFSPPTYAIALHFLQSQHVQIKGYMAAVMAIGEPLGIAVVIVILGKKHLNAATSKVPNFMLPFMLGPCLLLILSLVAGLVVGGNASEVKSVQPFFGSLFMGVLSMFVLAEGLLISSELKSLLKHGVPLIVWSIVFPLVGALIGLCISYLLHVSSSVALLLTVLCASANFTTVPAVFRDKFPDADAGVYETMPLCITFTFNVIIGIHLYWYVIGWLGL